MLSGRNKKKEEANPQARLGDMLLAEGVITDAQLDEALDKKAKEGKFLGRTLVDLGYIDDTVLVAFLVKQLKIPHINLADYDVSKEALALLPAEVCKEHYVLPIDKLGKILTVAMVDPLDNDALEVVAKACPDLKIKKILCDWHHFDMVVRNLFGEGEDADGEGASFYSGLAEPSKKVEKKKTEPKAEKASEEGLSDEQLASVVATAKIADEDLPEAKEIPTAKKTKTPPTGDRLTELADAAAQAERAAQMAQQAADRATTAAKEAESARVLEAKDEEIRNTDGWRIRQRETANMDKAHRDALEAIDGPGLELGTGDRVMAALRSVAPLKGYTFDSFFCGENNEFTISLGKAIAKLPGDEYNPFFLYGEVGIGKTHIINAIGNFISENHPLDKVGYVPAARFAESLSDAKHYRMLDQFRSEYCRYTTLILDDIQFLGGNIDAQEEFFSIFNALYQEGRQIIIAADKPPDQLGHMQRRLISRFASGIVACLKSPEWDTRMEILRHHCKESETDIPEDILAILASRISNDVRRMTGSLRKIVAFSDLVGQDITKDMAHEILGHLGAEAPA